MAPLSALLEGSAQSSAGLEEPQRPPGSVAQCHFCFQHPDPQHLRPREGSACSSSTFFHAGQVPALKGG